jgi:hypothetical protein
MAGANGRAAPFPGSSLTQVKASMANEQYAFIHKQRVPTPDEWQRAIDEAGFDLQIDPGLVVFEHSGFLPCKLGGRDSGIETYYTPTDQLFDDPTTVNDLAGGRDYCISFRWGGRFREAACAMILSYSLARSFGATISYEGEAPNEDLAALRKETEQILDEAKKEK